MTDNEYWMECLSIAADEHDIAITPEQLSLLAAAARSGHECYGMAFYSPPTSDRTSQVNREWERKYAELEQRFASYRLGSEKAIKRALAGRLYSDSSVSITEHGEVFSHGGRTERIL